MKFTKQKENKIRKKIFTGLLAVIMLLSAIPAPQAWAKTVTPVKPIVIVLDPGHGGYDGGATHRWNGKMYREKDANLAIAKACKKKLETYTGVKVYMTRSSDYFVSLSGRVAYAKKNNADLFVALHNNSSIRTSVKGACVYYPNANYNAKVGATGKAVAQSIQNRLVALGLKNNGVLTRSSENRSRYPDKSLADYYSVIKNSKSAGFPGLIVEHAYISNAGDCTKYLGSNEMLTKLGEADALGIASYYGLIPKTSVNLTTAEVAEDKTVLLQWSESAGVDGYCVYRRKKGTSKYQLVKKIKGQQNTQYTDNSIECGVTYEYGICGYHAGKNATTYTELSNVKEVLYTVAVPQNVNLQQKQSGSWLLTWDAADGVSGYRIECRLAGENDYTQIAKVAGADVTSFEISADNLGKGTEYRICSYYESDGQEWESAYSTTVSVN